MNTLTYLLVKETFWDQLVQEFKDVIEMFSDFFLMIKEVTYDVLVGYIGADMTNLMLIAVAVIGIMVVCITVINK